MSVSIFPLPAAEGGANDFLLDMGDYTDNTVTFSRTYPAGGYNISVDPTDATIDFYFVASDGTFAGYTNSTSVVVQKPFDTIVVLGSQANAKMTFVYGGESAAPSSSGGEVGAGAYIASVDPTDLPDIDDTTVVTGGNFAVDVDVDFVSGETTLPAKNVVRTDSTSLIVTRPDALSAAASPWSLEVSNPGVPKPTGSNAYKAEVTAGSVVTWVTTSLDLANIGSPYSFTLSATDPDGSVTYSVQSGSLPTGISLNASTGELSGTPASAGGPITFRATDAGGNFADFATGFPVVLATGGTIGTKDGYVYHLFDSSGTFEALDTIPTLEYLVLAGGGGGGGRRWGSNNNFSRGSGSGGAGGYRSSLAGLPSGGGAAAEAPFTSLPAGSYTVTIGAGGAGGTGDASGVAGSATSFHNITTVGGGLGGGTTTNGGAGGSGGGGGNGNQNGTFASNGGAGTANQGYAGAGSSGNNGGTGGGAGGLGVAGGGAFFSANEYLPVNPLTINATNTELVLATGGSMRIAQNFAQGPFTTPYYGSGGVGWSYALHQNVTNWTGGTGASGLVLVRY